VSRFESVENTVMTHTNGTKEVDYTRTAKGRFAVGTRPGPGRLPEQAEEKARFAALMREEIRKRHLAPERMGVMAAGVGKHAKLSPKFQHEVVMAMLAYGYGRPAQLQIESSEEQEQRVTYVKRIIGISEDDL
jgi:hypothetical protein